MAPKTNKKTKTNGSKVAAPSGFAPLRSRCDGFFAREVGNTIQGVLLGKFTVKGGEYGDRGCFRIRITEGETVCGDGELLGPGKLVGLDEKGWTKKLNDVEIGTEVWVHYEGQGEPEEIVNPKTGKKTFKQGAHLFDVQVRSEQAE